MGDIPVGVAFWRYRNLTIERPPLPNCSAGSQSSKSREAYRPHVMLPLT